VPCGPFGRGSRGCSFAMTAEAAEQGDDSIPYQRRPYRRDQERRRNRRKRSRSRKPAKKPSKSEGCSGAEAPFEFKPHHSTSVPRELNLDSVFDVAEDGSITTVMLRHIPCKYTQGNLLREIDQMGFESTYDFFYLPMDSQNKTSVGYAFLNFLDAVDAERFTNAFMGYQFKRHQNDKIAEVSPAKIQGLRNNVIHFVNSAVVHARNNKCRPIVLQRGIKRDFSELLMELRSEMMPPPGLLPPLDPAAFEAETVLAELQAPTSQLNAWADEFIPSGSVKTLNPMAEEFVPSTLAVTKPPPPLAESVPSAETIAPSVTASVLTSQTSGEVLKEARTDLEDTLRLLLRQLPAQTSVANSKIVELAPTQAVADSKFKQLKLPSKCFMAEEPCVGEGGWVAQAFEVLVDDLACVPSVGHRNHGSGGWVAEAFQHLIDEETLRPIQAECWVAEAFTNLVCGVIGGTPKCADGPQQSRSADAYRAKVTATSPSGVSSAGGGWIAEAFRALTSVGTPRANTPRMKTLGVQEGGWIAEAFRTLCTPTNKKLADRYPAEEMPASPAKLTPRSMTPRLGDALQRLQDFGGWAWIAFA